MRGDVVLPSLLHQADTSHDHTEKVSTYGWRLRNFGKLKTFHENGHVSLYHRINPTKNLYHRKFVLQDNVLIPARKIS